MMNYEIYCSCDGLEVETPSSILADEDLDVFAEIMADFSTDSSYEQCQKALWSRYRHRMIGSCDRDFWIENFKDHINESWGVWKLRFSIFDENKAEITDLAEEDSTTTISRSGSDTHDYTGQRMPETVVSSPSDAYYDRHDVDTTTLGTMETVQYKKYGGLNSLTITEAMAEVTDPYPEWARSFELMFINQVI